MDPVISGRILRCFSLYQRNIDAYFRRTNVGLFIKNLLIERFAVPDLSSSVRQERSPAILITATVGRTAWRGAARRALTLTARSQPYLDTASAPACHLKTSRHSFTFQTLSSPPPQTPLLFNQSLLPNRSHQLSTQLNLSS